MIEDLLPASLVFSEDYYSFDLGTDHPMNSLRLRAFKLLVDSLGLQLYEGIEFVKPVIADYLDILQVHTKKYVEAMKLAEKTQTEMPEFGIGNNDCPAFPRMEEVSRLSVGGTLLAIRHVLEKKKRVSFNVLGGLHHAKQDRASGFCYYNDCNIGIEYTLKQGKKRILYLDTDCHSGDGVSQYFYFRPEVFTLSLHESGMYLFPGTDFEYEIGEGLGKGKCANLPLMPGTTDNEYLPVAERAIKRAFEIQDPDIVFWQCGVDTYLLDPITDIRLSTACYKKIAEIIRNEILKRDLSIICLGGGGYSPLATSRGWLTQFLTLIGYNELPTPGNDWIQFCKRENPNFPFCDTLLDNFQFPSDNRQKDILNINMETEKRLESYLSQYNG